MIDGLWRFGTRPEVLLAGERNGLRIRALQTGGPDFDLGNSPREFTRESVNARTIVMTTTNGTRALRACASAQSVLIGSFLGMRALANWIAQEKPRSLLLVCSGTLDQAAYEDVLAAGALCEAIWPSYSAGSVPIPHRSRPQIYSLSRHDLWPQSDTDAMLAGCSRIGPARRCPRLSCGRHHQFWRNCAKMVRFEKPPNEQ